MLFQQHTFSRLMFVFVATVLATFLTTLPASAWYEDHRPTQSKISKMKKQGLIPLNMGCRNKPDAGRMLRPQVGFNTAPNKDRRAWVALAYYDNLDWQPGRAGSTAPFKKKYSKAIRTAGSGRTFRCSLWIGPKGSLGKYKKIGRWARTAGSTLSTR